MMAKRNNSAIIYWMDYIGRYRTYLILPVFLLQVLSLVRDDEHIKKTGEQLFNLISIGSVAIPDSFNADPGPAFQCNVHSNLV